MAQPAANTTDRLPWLTESPRPAPPPSKPSRKRLPWGWLAGAAAAVIAIGGGAYWFGPWRSQENRPAASAPLETLPSESISSEDVSGIPSVSDMTAADELTAEKPVSEPTSEARPQQGGPSAADQSDGNDETASEPRETGADEGSEPSASDAAPVQPLIRGRIIQLGAYPTRVQADYAWRAAVKRWPYLASKPRLISPLEVRSTDGKATRMYRLQLATASQAQSVVICQQLEGGGQSCVVVY